MTYRRAAYSIVLAVILFMAIISCNNSESGISFEQNRFLKCKDEGMVKGGYLFRYDPATCQRVMNRGRKQLSLQRDDHFSYVNIEFEEHPLNIAEDDQVVNVLLTYRLGKSLQQEKLHLEMDVLKSQDMKIWVWNEDMGVGLIVSL